MLVYIDIDKDLSIYVCASKGDSIEIVDQG
jgi:hypothetical protein